MKNVKKALIGTALAGTLVIGAGAGTYSWFNAEYKVSGEVTNHTLEINDSTESSDILFETSEKLAPGRTVNDSFSIENTGSMKQIIRAKMDLALYDKNGVNIGSPDKSGYSLDATFTFTRGGTTFGPYAFENIPAQQLDDLLGNNTWLPSDSGLDIGEVFNFHPGDKLDVDLDVNLLGSAGNEYQEKTLKGALEVDGKQTDAGAEFND
jgi:spore coat-associated protein N